MTRMGLRLTGSVLGFVGTLGVMSPVLAGTIIDVETNMGAYKLELYDDLAPATVARFINNVQNGSYHFSMIHFASSTFYIGGMYTYPSCGAGPQGLSPAINPITLETTNLDNDPGTIAMVRDRNNPNLVTGEWVLNFGYNSPLFRSPEFTDPEPVVIGKIIEGYANADRVLDQWRTAVSGASPSVPTVNYDNYFSADCRTFTPENLVRVAMEVLPPANSFTTSVNLLKVTADAGDAGLLSVSFTLVHTAPEVIIQALPETLTTLTETVPYSATFDAATGTLTIPRLVVDGQEAYTNMVFTLSNQELSQFTLRSVD